MGAILPRPPVGSPGAVARGMERARKAVLRLMVKEVADGRRLRGQFRPCPSWREPLPSEEKR